MGVEDLFGLQRERETRHHVRHDCGARSIYFPAERHAVRPVAQSENRIGMRMVDEFVRDERVQQSLDRWIGCGTVEQVAALDCNHLLITEGLETGEFQQRGEPHGRQTRRLDRRHIPARALHAQHFCRLPGVIAQDGFDRRITTAMLDQARVAAEQASRICAQSQVFVGALCAIGFDRGSRVAVGPQVTHAPCSPPCRRLPGRAGAIPSTKRRRRHARSPIL